jgi:hypothetical protein
MASYLGRRKFLATLGGADPIGMLRCSPLATHSGRSPVSEIWKGNSAIVGHALPESLTIDGLV